jgi:NAD(P)-dependent dehydrogenase (short-subunit alcohol dehydrogenase family)
MRALITGAATGSGAACVDKLKAQGYEIVALDIAKPDNVDQWIKVDMCDPGSIDKAVGELSGKFDCLINNAGLPPRKGLEKSILAVNFTGMVKFTNAVLAMINEGCSIVVTASRAGAAWRENIEQIKALFNVDNNGLDRFIVQQGIGHVRAYNLSKEAAILWAIGQTERLTTMGLRINCVSPAAVSTGILSDFVAAFGEKMARNVERVGRPGTPQEVADLILFLASRESHWLRGNDITIDGGMSALAIAEQLKL